MKTAMIAVGNFIFTYRNTLFPLFLIGAFIVARPTYPFGSAALESLFDFLGIACALGGQALRALTIGLDYIVRGGKNKQIYADTLVQGGVFAHVRNPLYIGNFFIFLGLALIFCAPGMLIVGIPLVLFIYATMILAEEEYLRSKFGAQYEDYCARVNRLWPNWRGFKKSIEYMQFNWNRLISKEHNTTFGWLLGAIAFELRGEYAVAGAGYLNEIHAYFLVCLFAALTAAYAVVHTYKKAGAFS